jgi:hypothetical protein
MGYLLACDVHYDLSNHGAISANYQEGTMGKLELDTEKFLELLTEMWAGDVGRCGPSSRILLHVESGEMELRNEAGSLHSWFVPGAVVLADRDAGTAEDDLTEADGDSIDVLVERAEDAVDYQNRNGE